MSDKLRIVIEQSCGMIISEIKGDPNDTVGALLYNAIAEVNVFFENKVSTDNIKYILNRKIENILDIMDKEAKF